jgi:hypothetical protein
VRSDALPHAAPWHRGCSVVIVVVLACAVGPSTVPFDQPALNMRARFREPFVSVHLLGTDELGRDMLARLLMAAPVTIGFAAAIGAAPCAPSPFCVPSHDLRAAALSAWPGSPSGPHHHPLTR